MEAGSIGGFFHIEAELGRGGMAHVYRVRDQRSGEQLALKQLDATSAERPSYVAMFEREYHTLVQLAHPRIVKAFDYGLDDRGPFYTMELLPGQDVRAASKQRALDVSQICLLLRDSASALSLIHSRRMVHRDVSSRNVWCTPEGRAKLIDLGTLVAMGPQQRVAGTPPFVPPEAVYSQPLDARSDLYALGALAYYLLTRRHAFPAREMRDLRLLWQQRPPAPHELVAALPETLSDLVMALLSFDPRARPASAAEVCERLTAVAQLPPEDERHLGQAFLTSPKLVGRAAESRLLRARLGAAARKRGGAIALVAQAGLGRSRMLDSLVLEAKLKGATAVSIDAGAVEPEPLALVTAMVERLLEERPALASAQSSGHGGNAKLLGHLSPAVRRAFGEIELAPLPGHQARGALSSAIVELVRMASDACPALLLAIDDVHLADDASLGVLARLSLAASGTRLLLVTACDRAALAGAPPALAQLTKPPQRLELVPLAPSHTQELVRSLFGQAPGLQEAAAWLHELSHGSPATCMHYAQHLVDQGLARYASGRWKLPENLRAHELPESLSAMLEARIAALGNDARTLALGLALARDETRAAWQPESHLAIEALPVLIDGGDSARCARALSQLLQAGVVEQRDTHYVLGQRAFVDALLRVTSWPERRAAHLRLARIFEHTSRQRYATAIQLQRAGEPRRAREWLFKLATHMDGQAMDWGAMRVSLLARCASAALADWQQQGGSPREGVLLRRLLLMTCSVYDWSTARVGDAQLARLRRDCGLVFWDDTAADKPHLERLQQCFERAQEAYDAAPEEERGLAPADALRELATTAMSLSGAFVQAHDIERARALQAMFEPLSALSPLLELLHELCTIAVMQAGGRELGNRIEQAITRLIAETALPDVLRFGGAAIYLHKQAIEDARLGNNRALAFIELLVPGAGEDMFLVLHGRWLCHAFSGQSELAEDFRKRVEVITEDDIWRRKAFLFVEAQLHAMSGDLLALDRVTEEIAKLAATFPGWRPWLLWARAHGCRLRGEVEAAAEQLDAALALAPAGEHRGWPLIAPARAELQLLRGDARGAIETAQAIARECAALELDKAAEVAAKRVRALAHSALGEHEAALACIEQARTAAQALSVGGLPLAVLQEARARVALGAGDTALYEEAETALWSLIERANAPALFSAYERLREQTGGQLATQTRTAGSGSESTMGELSRFVTQARDDLQKCLDASQRAEHALRLIVDHCQASDGHLFLLESDELVLAASTDGAGQRWAELARQSIEDDADDETRALGGADGPAAGEQRAPAPSAKPIPILLWSRRDGVPAVTGVALVEARDQGFCHPSPEIVRVVSECLQPISERTVHSGRARMRVN